MLQENALKKHARMCRNEGKFEAEVALQSRLLLELINNQLGSISAILHQ